MGSISGIQHCERAHFGLFHYGQTGYVSYYVYVNIQSLVDGTASFTTFPAGEKGIRVSLLLTIRFIRPYTRMYTFVDSLL